MPRNREESGSADAAPDLPLDGWRAGFAVAGVALALRLLHLWSLSSLPTVASPLMDEGYHDGWARRIAAGDWLGAEVFFRAPLYPYFLGTIYSLLGPDGIAARATQCLVGAAGVILLHRIALRAGSPPAAALAALLMAICWPLIFFDNELLLPVLEVPLSLASILLLLRADEADRRPVPSGLAGAMLGLAALARPNMLAFAPAAAVWLVWARAGRRIRPWPAAAFLIGLLIPIAPVAIRNCVVGDDFVLIASQGGVNFYIGNNPEADGTTAVVPGTRPTWHGGYEDAVAIAREARGGEARPSEVSRYWFRRGLAFWRNEPAAALRLTARKGLLLLSGTEVSNNKDLAFFRSLSPILSLPLPSAWLLSPLGIVGWVLALRRPGPRRRVLLPPLLFAVSYGGSIVVFFVTSRFRAPILPVMALGTALFAMEIARRTRAGRPVTLIVPLAAAAVLLGVLNRDLGYRDDPAQGHLTLGLALESAGSLEEARGEFDRGLEHDSPFRYELQHRKGLVLLGLGRTEAALEPLESSVRLRPDNGEAVAAYLAAAVATGRYREARERALALTATGSDAAVAIRFAVGSMDQREGDEAEAEEQYRKVLEKEPRHLGARINLALLLRAAGRHDASLGLLLEAERFHPTSPEVQINLAKHYLFMGDRDRAWEHARGALRAGGSLDPGFARALGRPPP